MGARAGEVQAMGAMSHCHGCHGPGAMAGMGVEGHGAGGESGASGRACTEALKPADKVQEHGAMGPWGHETMSHLGAMHHEP